MTASKGNQMKPQMQRFQIEFPAPAPEQAELVMAHELQDFLETAIERMKQEGEPQDTDSLFYADLKKLKVTSL